MSKKDRTKLQTLLLCMSLSCSGTVYGQAQQVNLSNTSKKEMTLKEAFKEIEKQTKLLIDYTSNDLNDSRKLQAIPAVNNVESILRTLLKDTNCEFKFLNGHILIRKKNAASSQQQGNITKVTGTVLDSNGISIIGANVRVKGETTTGTITDIDGNFVLDAPENSIIQISFIGYLPQEVKANKGEKLNIKMVEDNKMLNEVVVVGYGTQKKANLTGSVASVKMDELLGDRPVASTAQALEGAAPGLQIITNTGRPGQNSTLNIRGYTSINGGNPLVLVDNAEVESINDINPKDIESISVLKDASASAIYGARGAFGVILITTKRGEKEGKVKVNYNANFAFTSAMNLPKKLSTYETAKLYQEWEVPDNNYIYNIDKWVELLEDYKQNPGKYPDNGVYIDESGNQYPLRDTYDYWDKAFNSGFEQIHNVSLSGGSKKSAYRISLGYTNQDGILITDKDSYKRYNLNTSLTSNITSNLTASINLFYKNDKRKTPNNMWKVFANGVLYPPYAYEGIYTDPSTNEQIPYWTPENFLSKEPANLDYGDQVRLHGRLDWKPINGLTLGAEYTMNSSNKYAESITTTNKYLEGSTGNLYQPKNSAFNKSNTNRIYQSFNATAKYDYEKAQHNLSAIIGVNYEDSKYKYMNGNRKDLITADLPTFGTAYGDMTVSDDLYEWAIAGYFGRINYNYKEKYLLELSARYDGSSRFAPGDRFVFVPSGSIGWHISREKFMESLAPTLSSLKVFASYGEIGNQNTGSDYYPYVPTMNTYNAEWIDLATNIRYLTIGAPKIVSSGFTWERVRTLNIGADFGLINNRLTGTLEWYRRQTLGMLDAALELPAVLGTKAPKQNVTDLETKGWEINLTWKDQIGKVKYSIGGNLYDSRAYITDIALETGNIYANYKGKELGEIWGYETIGFYNIDDFEEGVAGKYTDSFTLKDGIAPFKNRNHIPGDIRFADLDGSGVVDYGTRTLEDHGDLKRIGNNRPRFQYGINGMLSYANFDLSFFLQGVGKRDRFINDYLTTPYNTTFTYSIFEDQKDVWSESNQDAFFPRVMSRNYNLKSENQTRYMFNGAYLNVKNITLGYNLPAKLIKKIGINKLRCYMSGENLFIFDHMPDGIQTESYVESSGAAYPTLRKISFGIDITL